MDLRDGLPKLTQVSPRFSCKDRTTIDIIAVHGIETHSPKTWTAYERDEEPRGRATNWLCDKDMLPEAMPQACIWTYDYNSNCYSDNAPQIDLLGLGETFLEILRRARDQKIGERSLIFIGSCFGGIVIAQALERAYRGPEYEYLLKSTIGVVFLGTPLRGTKTASIAEWVALIRGFLNKETSDTLLQSLRENESSLDTLVHEFSKLAIKLAIAHNFQIRCFYETRRTRIVTAVLRRQLAKFFPFLEVEIVSKESACLDGHKRLPLGVCHGMMNKFRGPDDPNFLLVSSSLKEIAQNTRINQCRTAEELECLQCLTSNYREDKDRNEQRVPGTCEWFLEHQKFLSWQQKDTASLLWVSADPGCGKSVLSRFLVDEVLSFDSQGSSVCYFFFKDDDANRQSGAQALCAILHQLFVQKPELLKHAMSAYEKSGAEFRTMFQELWDILMKCASDSNIGKIICVLDALDECEKPARDDLITQLTWLYSARNNTHGKLKFLATSRPYHDIERRLSSSIKDKSTIRLEGENQIESDKISKEIDLVISYQVPLIARSRRFPLGLEVQDALMNGLRKTPNRTYLWLHLILEVVRESLDSRKDPLLEQIEKLPHTVEEAYEKILGKINRSDYVEKARRLLHIIVAAARPLTLQELNIALTIDEKLQQRRSCRSYHDLDLESQEEFQDRIRNLCGLFVSIQDSKIYLIHQTAKEFLISKDTSSAKSNLEVWKHSLNSVVSNSILAKICLSYLMFDELKHQDVKSLKSDVRLFLGYVAVHWTFHYRQARNDLDSVLISIRDLCDTGSNRFRLWFRSYCGHYSIRLFSDITNLIIASYFGLEALVKLLLEQTNIGLNLGDNFGRTALQWAAENGHTEVVKLLLQRNEIEVNLKDINARSALSRATEKGHTEVVTLLLKRNKIEVNVKDKYDRTALSLATERGHTEVVKLLLKRNEIEVNFKDRYGRTALSLAAERGHTEVVKLLLERNEIEVNVKDIYGQTVLSLAAERGQTEDVKLLLEQNEIEVNIKAQNCYTALLWAAKKGHTEVVKLLLERNEIEVNFQEYSGCTALLWAAERGHAEVVNLLLEQNAVEVNLTDNHHGRTALLWAAERGHREVVTLLLKWDEVEVNLKDKCGQTALSLAAKRGHTELVRLLLKQNAIEVNFKDDYAQTALSLAVKRGHTEVVRLLLERDEVEVNLKDESCFTALLWAAMNAHTEVVRLLLERDEVEVNLKDNCSQTALSLAAKRGHTEVVRLLLERDEVEVNVKDIYGKTALSPAAERGHTEVVRLLLERDEVEVNLKGIYGRTALSLAADGGHTEVVKLLLKQNEVEVNLKANWGQTALSLAAERGYPEVIKLLLERNEIEVNLKDNCGQTALSLAVKRGHPEVVRLLLERDEVEVNLKDNCGRTALLLAAKRGHPEVVKLLLERDEVEVNLKDDCGQTALSLAAEKGHAEVVKLLLQRNEIEVNLTDKYRGRTALLWAAERGHTEVVRLLLKHNEIDLNIKDNDAQTALFWAAEKGHPEVVKLLLEQNAIEMDNYAQSALSRATENDRMSGTTSGEEEDDG
ncbi:hypothetical protein MMC29_002260 [Sticta canariensis]|nr:hypothetical protein [Sticta canariensis]